MTIRYQFSMADSWPELLTGRAVIDDTQGMNLPIAGAIAAVTDVVELIPIVWCAAEPSPEENGKIQLRDCYYYL